MEKRRPTHWRRFTNEENVIHREDYCDGRNEIKREGGDNSSDQKKQDFWGIFHDNDETRKNEEEATQKAADNQDERDMERKTTSVELGDLMTKLNEIDKK